MDSYYDQARAADEAEAEVRRLRAELIVALRVADNARTVLARRLGFAPPAPRDVATEDAATEEAATEEAATEDAATEEAAEAARGLGARMLEVLAWFPADGVSLHEMRDYYGPGVSASAGSSMLTAMRQKGLVSRARQRGGRWRLTSEGRAVRDALRGGDA